MVKILLAEDSDDDILIIKDVFRNQELVRIIAAVKDGLEALAYLRGEGCYAGCQAPDLLIMDINMPKKNGLETLTEIKQDPRLKFIPVVMLTGSESEKDMARAYGGGASAYIVKPVTLESFTEAVKAFSRYWGSCVRLLPPEEYP